MGGGETQEIFAISKASIRANSKALALCSEVEDPSFGNSLTRDSRIPPIASHSATVRNWQPIRTNGEPSSQTPAQTWYR